MCLCANLCSVMIEFHLLCTDEKYTLKMCSNVQGCINYHEYCTVLHSSDQACDRLQNWCHDSNDLLYKECMVNSRKMSLCKLALQTDYNVVKLEEEDKIQTPDEHVYKSKYCN